MSAGTPTTDRYPFYAEVREHWTKQGRPDIAEKVCRAWDIVYDRVQPRDGKRVVEDDDGERVALDSDPTKVISGQVHVEGDEVWAVLLGDGDANTYSVIERIEVSQ